MYVLTWKCTAFFFFMENFIWFISPCLQCFISTSSFFLFFINAEKSPSVCAFIILLHSISSSWLTFPSRMIYISYQASFYCSMRLPTCPAAMTFYLWIFQQTIQRLSSTICFQYASCVVSHKLYEQRLIKEETLDVKLKHFHLYSEIKSYHACIFMIFFPWDKLHTSLPCPCCLSNFCNEMNGGSFELNNLELFES